MTDNKSNKRVFFLHFRPQNIVGGISSRPSAFTNSKGGFTVAYSYDKDGVRFAVATVSMQDAYVKAIGRDVASKRLAEKNAGFWPGSVDEFRSGIYFALQARQYKRDGI